MHSLISGSATSFNHNTFSVTLLLFVWVMFLGVTCRQFHEDKDKCHNRSWLLNVSNDLKKICILIILGEKSCLKYSFCTGVVAKKVVLVRIPLKYLKLLCDIFFCSIYNCKDKLVRAGWGILNDSILLCLWDLASCPIVSAVLENNISLEWNNDHSKRLPLKGIEAQIKGLCEVSKMWG